MAHMDIFNNDAFRAMDLSEAIEVIPNQWGLIGELGLFTPTPVRGVDFSLEQRNGVLQIVGSSTRGTSLPGAKRAKRNLKKFETARFGLKSKITAGDIDQIRAFGSTTELMQVIDEVSQRQVDLRENLDITREYLRSGALQGKVLDADGSELLDLFDVFGVTRKEADFKLGTETTDLMAKCREVTRHIKTNLKGDVSNGVMALMHPDFTDKLMGHADFKERYKFYQNQNGGDPLRDDESDGFLFGGIWWKEYMGEGDVPQEDGTSITRNFVPAGEAMAFPRGTRKTFRQFNGSADYMDMTNMPGIPFYSAVFPDVQEKRFVDVEAMMQTMPVCMRPATLVRVHTSN